MDVPPIAGVDELEAHLHELTEVPETPLQIKLLDDVELQLTEANTYPLIPRILPVLINVLSTTPHNPDQIVSLAIRLLRPVSFTQAMTLANESSLVLALQSPAPSAALLALTVIQKASRTPSDAGILSNMQSLVHNLIMVWLSNPSVEVGESATRALSSLFEADCDVPSTSNATLNLTMNGDNVALRPQTGQGLFWRRIFQDQEIYSSIFSLCSHTTPNIDERQKSLAQARLLRIIPHLATLDFTTISRSQFPTVEASYGLSSPAQQSLLYFAIFKMVDKSDVLMHITLLDFLREFLDTLAMVDLDGDKLAYLNVLMIRAARDDAGIVEMMKALRESPTTTEELGNLLVKLNLGT